MVLSLRGPGVSFQVQTICPEVVERHHCFCIHGSSPTEQVCLSDEPRMCLSGDPFVPKMGAVRAEESCGFELEKRPPDPWFRCI